MMFAKLELDLLHGRVERGHAHAQVRSEYDLHIGSMVVALAFDRHGMEVFELDCDVGEQARDRIPHAFTASANMR